ncbi:MAG: purine-nucleoside phosphorylase [Anaerolineae bacterium]|nr:purine-nucleoside phosphorylase [Anaerolineae bacterium]
MFKRADYLAAVEAIRSQTTFPAKVGVVLGSGLGGLADAVENAVSIPYSEIPGFPVSTVHGHAGELVIGTLEGSPVITQRGRAHFYEGYTPQQVVFPVRVMHYLGIETLILTNAAGGVNAGYKVADVMILNDHINFVGMMGNNPLMGPNDETLGSRFPGMSQTYDRDLRQYALRAAQENNVPYHEGVYMCLSGPTFETPAEIRMIRLLGGDAVGMSTVHEVIAARHAGMKVLAMSGITNECIDAIDTPLDTNHEEVLEAGKLLVPRMSAIIRGVLRSLAQAGAK